MAAVEFVRRDDVEDQRELRHCPNCCQDYRCLPRYRPNMCPTCLGQRSKLLRAKPDADVMEPPPTNPAPGGQSELDLEITAMRITARWLEDLDGASRARVMAWLWSRYGE